MAARPPTFLDEYHDILLSPCCGRDLALQPGRLECSQCRRVFPVTEGIPQLFVLHEADSGRQDVTEAVKAFYEETPFPNYDDFDSVGSLIQKARLGRFAKLLDDGVPPGSLVLECGCGTGQLSNFLSIANRTVFGTDMCLNSLRLGQQFKDDNRLSRVHFMQMNLFRPVFCPGTFDLVISNGVLHHTSDPRRAFGSIAPLVRPGGHILVGLYHRYGRLTTDFRRALFRLSGDRFTWLDPNLRDTDRSAAKRRAWFRDQYRNPHESKHTIGEVAGWLRETGFEFVRSVPPTKPFQPPTRDPSLFAPDPLGNPFERRLAELSMVRGGSREGGFFVVIGRRPTSQKSV